MWLENGLNSKQILARFSLLFALFFTFDLYLDRRLALIFLGVVFSYLIWIVYQLLAKGFYVLLAAKKIGKKTYQVRNRIFPLNLKKSYREIAPIQSLSFTSRSPIFSNDNDSELYLLEIINSLTKTLRLKKILILGGAGCSFATFFAKKIQIRKIDVLEYNQTMIEWANKYFLNKNKKIQLVHGDGLYYTKYFSDYYDLVIIDMFEGPIFEDGINSKFFIKMIKKSIGDKGFFVMNLGYTVHLEKVTKTWQKFFPLYVYLSNKNICISNIKFSSFAFNSPHRFLLEIPQLNNDSN